MKRISVLAMWMAVAGGVLAIPAAAQIQIPLDSLAAKASDTKGVALDQSMLKLAANFLAGGKAKDPGFQKILAGLKSITVKKYTFAQEGAYQSAELEPLRAVLRTGGWSDMITMHKDGGERKIYIKMDGLQINGVTVVAADPKDVVVVSVEGVIDLAKLAQLAGHMGIPSELSGIDPGSNQKTTDQKSDSKPAN
jgi:hypothetical protein